MGEKIIGIDPGSINTGIAIIETQGNKIKLITKHLINSKKFALFSDKLKNIFTKLDIIIKEFKPDYSAVELVFMAKNAKSSLMLGHVRGAILTCLSINNVPIFDYSAKQIKQSIVGNGQANKIQVQKMVQILLNNHEKIEHDISDAIAAAICHHNNQAINKKIK